MDQAFKRWRTRSLLNHYNAQDEGEELPDVIVELGSRYNNSAAIMYINGARGAIYEDPFWPTSFPGSRAPHVWLRGEDTSESSDSKSLYDHFEPGKFSLLCSRSGGNWVECAEELSDKYPIKTVIVPSEREFLSKYKIHDSGAVIVRPDGIIGWKAQNDAELGLFEVILKQLLCFTVAEDEMLPSLMTRTRTVPEVDGLMRKMTLSQKTPSRKTAGPGGLLRRMTTMRTKKKSTSEF